MSGRRGRIVSERRRDVVSRLRRKCVSRRASVRFTMRRVGGGCKPLRARKSGLVGMRQRGRFRWWPTTSDTYPSSSHGGSSSHRFVTTGQPSGSRPSGQHGHRSKRTHKERSDRGQGESRERDESESRRRRRSGSKGGDSGRSDCSRTSSTSKSSKRSHKRFRD